MPAETPSEESEVFFTEQPAYSGDPFTIIKKVTVKKEKREKKARSRGKKSVPEPSCKIGLILTLNEIKNEARVE